MPPGRSSFQFYKVRLKQELHEVLDHLVRFQFYKVRLKHRLVGGLVGFWLVFQFYKVRLKHWRDFIEVCGSQISILQSSIKTAKAGKEDTDEYDFNSTKFD